MRKQGLKKLAHFLENEDPSGLLSSTVRLPEAVPISRPSPSRVPDLRDIPRLKVRFAKAALLPVKLAITNVSAGEVHVLAPGTVPVTRPRVLTSHA